MKIVIVGDGKVGFTLSKQLSDEGHDITVIDSNARVLQESQETLDIMILKGDGATLEAQTQAGVDKADFLIAATSKDEINLLCCVLARKLGCRHTIARVRNPEYEKQARFLKKELGLSLTINPERTTASEISRLLEVTAFSKRESFAKRRRVELVELVVHKGCSLVGKYLHQMGSVTKLKALVCVAQVDDGTSFIPKGDYKIEEGHRLTLAVAMKDLSGIAKDFGMENQRVKNVMIVGGGRIAVYLAQILGNRIKIKIIEQDIKRCEELAEILPNALIINGDGSLPEFLLAEGLADTDALIALTGIDEQNLVISICANAKGVQKCITKVNRSMYNSIFHAKGIDTIVSPKILTANEIVGYVRAADLAVGKGVVSLHRFGDGEIEGLEFVVDKAFPCIGVPMAELPIRDNIIVACIIRGSKDVIIPSGDDVLKEGDTIIVVAESKYAISELNQLLNSEGRIFNEA